MTRLICRIVSHHGACGFLMCSFPYDTTVINITMLRRTNDFLVELGYYLVSLWNTIMKGFVNETSSQPISSQLFIMWHVVWTQNTPLLWMDGNTYLLHLADVINTWLSWKFIKSSPFFNWVIKYLIFIKLIHWVIICLHGP